MNWIDVKTELPKIATVLVSYEYGVAEAKFFQGTFYNKELSCEMPNVEAWIPLPEKYIKNGG